MPYGHAESNDLLRNRERSIRAREKLRNGVMIFSTREWAIQTLENQNITEFLVF